MWWGWFAALILFTLLFILIVNGIVLGRLSRQSIIGSLGPRGATGTKGFLGEMGFPNDGPQGPRGPSANTSINTGITGMTGSGTGPTGPDNTTSLVPIRTTNTTDATTIFSGAIIASGGIGIGESMYVGGTINLPNLTPSFDPTSGSLLVTGTIAIQGSAQIDGQTIAFSQTGAAINVTAGGMGIGESLHDGRTARAGQFIQASTGLFAQGIGIPQFMARSWGNTGLRFTGGTGNHAPWTVLYAVGVTGAAGTSLIDYDVNTSEFILKARGRYLVTWDIEMTQQAGSSWQTWAVTSETLANYGRTTISEASIASGAIISINNPPQRLAIILSNPQGNLANFNPVITGPSWNSSQCVVELISLG